jgi:acyl-CoA reductase-like NAD-dependent aldehyde dehydrogenase
MTQTAKIISPIDGSVFAERATATANEVAQALNAAATAQRSWRNTPLVERAEICLRAVDAMLVMQDEIVPDLAWQMGRPVRYGAGELRGFADRARHMIAIAAEALSDVVPTPISGFRRFIKREPLGVVLVIAPWNYPFLTAVNAIVPALMAGNAVLLKHATQTFLVGDRFQAAFDRAGLPAGLFRHLLLDHEQAASIIRSGQIHQVNFTGSVAAGRKVALLAAERFLGVGLELGGKDPAYVCADANLEYAAANLVDGSFFNSGQSCCGIERIYVAQTAYAEFIERFAALTYEYVLASPLLPATTLGPLVTPQAATFVRKEIQRAKAEGARLLIDTKRFPADATGSAYMAPQVVIDVHHGMSLMRDENFGPVVGIMAVADDDEAVRLMNDSDYGLTASIWTTDIERALHIGDRVESGTVYMNRCDYLDPALAWTGVKDTGHGATLSRVGYEHMTRPKSFHLKHKLP